MATTTTIKDPNGLVYRGVKYNTDNLNDVHQNGYWSVYGVSMPINAPQLDLNVNGLFINYSLAPIQTEYQVWIEFNSGVKNRYERRGTYLNGAWSWSAWKKVVYQETDHSNWGQTVDLNAITNTGFFTVNGATNAPAEAPYGTLTVVRYSPGYITQTWNSVTGADMFFRYRNPDQANLSANDYWSSWRKISSTEVTQITT